MLRARFTSSLLTPTARGFPSARDARSLLPQLALKLPEQRCGYRAKFYSQHVAERNPRRLESEPQKGGSTFTSPDAEGSGSIAVLRNLTGYLWPANDASLKRRVLLSLVLLVASKATSIAVPFLFKHAVNTMAMTGSIATTKGVGLATIVPSTALIGYGAAKAATSLANEMRNAVFATVARKAIVDVSVRTFRHLHSLPLRFHLSRQTGALSRNLDRGQKGIDFMLRSMVFNLLPTAAEVGLVCTVLAVKYGTDYSAIAGGTVAAYTVFTLATTQWRTRFRKEMNRADNAASNKAVDSLLNYETVKYFGNEDHEARQYAAHLEKYGNAHVKTMASLSFLNFGQSAIFASSLSIIMLKACQEIVSGSMNIGDLVMVNSLLFQLSIPLNFLGTVYHGIKQSLIDMEAMFSLLNQKMDIGDTARQRPLYLRNDTQGKTGSIEFENVSFGYGAGRNILSNVSFRVPAGHTAAIVGPSGCGKSTIMRLLYGFYRPDRGRIIIDGQDIWEVDMQTLRQVIGVVPQETVLFNDTIRYNIAYGRLDATDSEIREAAKRAQIDGTIARFPEQYETQVGERGLKISGGEKQRLAIARVVLKDPKICLLDEVTSSLDSRTEADILESLRALTENSTSIHIAHRLSSIADVDKILVLNEGQVAATGTHEDLLNRKNGLYKDMWSTQNSQKKLKL
eukprot:Plantae.Rhodophyta-Hildenbrandia_rubra.ctg2132.p1 GENE.Plantae.Rhodophyta-Hildenbrandia_rubra.ctg2132~~Plantae.Rhodophyta-Hildenbrandia_rubra.ctg2132.p1  ORF type:complete len:682 (-),score=78.88 Plantae.Rhodophyta-Hildenbrandia_rubra.ctg2132:1104-3149(-)